MYSQPDIHTKSKNDFKSDINVQQGSGEEVREDTDTNSESNTNIKDLLQESKPLSNNDDPLEFNEQKRKRMGDFIHESFLHPSFVKTSKIVIESKPKNKSKETNLKPKNVTKSKDIKHKFKFA
jgi:hypothetical protein